MRNLNMNELKVICNTNYKHIEKFFKIKTTIKHTTKVFYNKTFLKWCMYKPFCNKDLTEWSKDDVIDAINFIHKLDLSDCTKKNYLAGLKALFNALDLETLARVIKIKLIPTKVTGKDLITPEELRKVIAIANNYRDKALLGFYWDTMCRLNEALKIRFSDVTYDSEHGMFEVLIRAENNKKAKNKMVYVVKHAKYFKDYLLQHPCFKGWESLAGNECYVWTNTNYGIHKNRSITCGMIGAKFKRLFKKAGIHKRFFMHLLRHSSATDYYKRNKDLLMLKRLGGWSSNSRICEEVYVNLCDDDIKATLLKQNGIDVKAKPEHLCPFCGVVNNVDKHSCISCGHVLDHEKFLEFKQEKKQLLREALERIAKLEAKY